MTLISKIKTRTYIHTNPEHTRIESKTVFVIEDNDIRPSNIINQLLSDREYAPVKGDKLYIFPGSSIPRFKVKNFCEKYKVALVKYQDKANIKIIGENFGKDLIKTDYRSWYIRTELLEHLEKYGNKTYTGIVDLIDLLKTQTSEIVIHDYYANQILKHGQYNNLSKSFKEKDIDDKLDDYYRALVGCYITDDNAYQTIIDLSNDPLLYSERSLLKLLNTGGIMDAKQYESIKRLFKSPDTSNHNLGVEAISNCDFEKSAVYLLLLVHDYRDEMYNSPNKNHINFKSFMKFFGIDSIRYGYNYDNIIQSLIERKLLNQSNLDVLEPLIKEEQIGRLSTEYFNIHSLVYSDKILEGLRDNILDKELITELYDEPQEELQLKHD